MTKPLITARDIQAAREMLERTRSKHSPEDHAVLLDMIEIVAELRTMVIELDGADDDMPLDEAFLTKAIARARARTGK